MVQVRVAHFKMAPPAGFEPATLSLTARCSTVELQGTVSRKANLRFSFRGLSFPYNVRLQTGKACLRRLVEWMLSNEQTALDAFFRASGL